MRDIIFRTYSSNLSYSRRNGQNIAEIYVHRSENRALYQTALSMVLGIVCGILMKQLPEFVSLIIEENILRTIQTVFLNALSLLLAPIVFFSITISFSRLSGGNEIGRIGGKVFSSFLFMTAAGTIAGFFVSKMLFASVGQMPSLFEDFSQASVNSNTEFSLHSFLIGIIPKNFVTPIQNGNMIEILFVSVMVGIAMCVLDEKVASLKKIFEEARTLFSRLMGMIVSFMPFVTFSAISLFVYKCT
ncbi:MAG: dicarboxylate/amino acid:cation symporter, partial [Treponema sp.]|nr:dicarboxylate/amino acid:cation symporter [Treponema sp.]